MLIRLGLLLIIGILITIDAFAVNPAIIFGSGGYAKNLASSGIELSNGVRWLELSADPTVSAVDAPEGSFGVFGTTLYIKQDAGSSTNWDVVSTNVITAQGDLIIGDASGGDIRLPLGTANYVLTSNGTSATWAPAPEELPLLGKGSLVTSNGTVNGEFSACADGEKLEWDAAEVSGVKCVSSFTNPTTTEGDLILRGATVDERLPIGTNAQVLTSDGTTASWADPVTQSPTTTRGDVIRRGAVADERLAIGTTGQILTSDGTDPVWQDPALQTPTTTRGDIIRRGAAADERLAIGTTGQILASDGTDPIWQDPVDPSPTTTQGDIIVRGATQDERLPIGTVGQVPKVNATGDGLEYDAPPYLGLLGKGSLITSNGTTNGEFTNCADDEILVYDAAEAAGIKCEAKPVVAVANFQVSGASGSFQTASTSFVTVTNLSVTITTSGNPVMLDVVTDSSTTGGCNMFTLNGGLSFFTIFRGGTQIAEIGISTGVTEFGPSLNTVDSIGAGTYTYTVQARNNTGGANTANMPRCVLVAREL